MAMASQSKVRVEIPIISKNSDMLMAFVVVSILSFMIIPLPPVLLDLLLSFNITFSLTVLLVGMYIIKPLEFSVFPSVLLIVTLFRLSLNIASTRIILLHGNEGTAAAGKVINAFGSFVVGGNYLVGIIVFLILVIINFVVITKGAGRIAEVAARFTLDGMPGKQMSIDADLNAGLISEEEARQRREQITQEAEYYGAMDGANKFVRGDAIAGIIITLINIIGGLAIGIFQNSMSFSHAAQNYTLLTVGDGLVTQVPALIVSTAAGIIVSRAGSESSLGKEITTQVLFHYRAVAVASAILFAFALVPGLPGIPFMVLSVGAAGLSFLVFRAVKRGLEKEEAGELLKEKERPEEKPVSLPLLDILALEVGYGIIHLVDTEQDGQLLDRIKSIRRQVAQEIGIIVPPIHIQDNMNLKPGEYRVLLKGNVVGTGELMANYCLAMDPGTAQGKLDGVTTKEPTYGLPATWIKESKKEDAIAKGYTVVDAATVLTTHISDIIRRYPHELLGRQDVQQMLDNLKNTHPKVVEELIPNMLSLGGVVKVLQNLLKEQVPVRDLLAILETLADWTPMVKDIDMLTEYVRHSLARTITGLHQTDKGDIPAITLGHSIEEAVAGAIQRSDQGSFVAMEPDLVQKIVIALTGYMEKFSSLNYQPVILCSAQIRSHFKKLIDRFISNIDVISYDELLSNIEIESLGIVELSNAD